MVLEMRRALDDLKNKDHQGYRKLFDTTYEEVYCRSLLIIQKEDQAVEFTKDFFAELLGTLEEAEEVQDPEGWFWKKYYLKMRKQYHRLLKDQETRTPDGKYTLAEIPASFPLLHRIMLVMFFEDDFGADEISGIFGLDVDKIQSELGKLERALPSLTKTQPESVAGYLGNWKTLFLGACRQIINMSSDEWVDQVYAEAAKTAGIAVEPEVKDEEPFDYFVADVDVMPKRSEKKPAAPVTEDELDEEDEDEDDEEEEDDGRYDWDLEDDGKKLVILGVVLALIVVVLVGVAAFRLLNKTDDSGTADQTEQELDAEGEAPLIVRGDDSDDSDDAAGSEANPEEELPEEDADQQEEESQETVTMQVIPASMRLRSEPNTDCDVVGSLKSGEKLEVLSDLSEEWVQVRCIEQDNREGYVKSENLKAVD